MHLALFLLLASSVVNYKICPASESFFELEVYKTGLMKGRKHVFSFERYTGELQFDSEKPENSKVRFAIDATNAVLRDTWVGEKDRHKIMAVAFQDMLAAERYPEIIFSSTRIILQSANHYQVQGTLTIRGITKPATADVEQTLGNAGRPKFDGYAQVKLSDYGLKPPSAALGMIGTRNEMLVRFQVSVSECG